MAIIPMTPAPEMFGEEVEEDALFEVRLRRITYNSGLMDSLVDEPVSHLQWQTHKVRTLKAATLARLVSELTPTDSDVDPSFLITFLSTYRAFTTSERLLDLLHARVSPLVAAGSVPALSCGSLSRECSSVDEGRTEDLDERDATPVSATCRSTSPHESRSVLVPELKVEDGYGAGMAIPLQADVDVEERERDETDGGGENGDDGSIENWTGGEHGENALSKSSPGQKVRGAVRNVSTSSSHASQNTEDSYTVLSGSSLDESAAGSSVCGISVCSGEIREHFSSSSTMEHSDIRKSLLAVIRLWIDQYPEDFDSDQLRDGLYALLDLCQGRRDYDEVHHSVECMFAGRDISSLVPLSQRLSRLSFQPSEVLQKRNEGPTPHVDLQSIPPSVIAQQLTLLDAELFCKVVPYHCLACVWSSRHRKHTAVTVTATVELFNRVSLLVSTTILKGYRDHRLGSQSDRPSRRAAILQHWILIAQECRRLKNFSSLRAIMSSLNSTPIERLGKTWAMVTKESIVLFEDLVTLTSHSDNDHTSRSLLMKEGTSKYSSLQKVPKSRFSSRSSDSSGVVQGVVPYLGTFLTDLTMIDSAHSDYVQENLINFHKRRKEFEVLAQLTLFQKAASNYSFESDHLLQAWVMEVNLLDEEAW